MTKIEYQEKAIELYNITKYDLADEIYESSQIATQLFDYALEIYGYGDFKWVLVLVFQAGKIEGIRKERVRRKATK